MEGRGDRRIVYRVWCGHLIDKDKLGGTSDRWKYNIKVDLQEVG